MENELICRSVMLITSTFSSKEQILWKNSNGHILFTCSSTPAGLQPQHLYLVSDREIKINDKYINTFTDKIEKNDSNEEGIDDIYKKIEATTDKSLGLPLIPQSFIEEYAQKQGKIDKVKIHIRGEGYCLAGMPITEENEVIILPIKDSWNRDEHRQGIIAGINWYRNWICPDKPFSLDPEAIEFNDWFDEKY